LTSCAAICARRQAGHQHPTASSGTFTAGGKVVHQHGVLSPSAIVQANSAPQRVQMLIVSMILEMVGERRESHVSSTVVSAAIKYNRTPPTPHKVYAVFT
jgi:hypothetical protein